MPKVFPSIFCFPLFVRRSMGKLTDECRLATPLLYRLHIYDLLWSLSPVRKQENRDREVSMLKTHWRGIRDAAICQATIMPCFMSSSPSLLHPCSSIHLNHHFLLLQAERASLYVPAHHKYQDRRYHFFSL